MAASAAKPGNVAMIGIDRTVVRLAIAAVVMVGVVDLTSACTIITNNCNVKDACPSGASQPPSASAAPASRP